MLKIKMLTGHFAGEVRIIPEETNPEGFMQSLFQHGWRWEIDYSQATDEEIYFWLRQDIAVRIVRAITTGLPVKFMDKVFIVRSMEPAEIEKTVGEAEDTIAESGRMITLLSDDEKRVVIEVKGFEH